MRFTFLGTAASEGFPMEGCRCANCEAARERSSALVRKRALGLVNDDLLLDFGPDVLEACTAHGVALGRVRYCLVTHADWDHLYVQNLVRRAVEYGGVGTARLHVYASGAVAEHAIGSLQADGWDFTPAADGAAVSAGLNLAVHRVAALQTFAVGPYRVTAFPANHVPAPEPLVYAVEGEGRAIFYGVDTAELAEVVWRTCHAQGLRFDLVALDHTYGPDTTKTDHLNPRTFAEHVARLRREGLLSDGARIFAHHVAHEPVPPRARLAASAAAHGYEVAYDGLAVEL
jgi:phosphoribosyl 1,2-cyclic phosphate phosphodiesterase